MAKGNKNPRTEFLQPFTTEGKHKGLSRSPVSVKLPPDLDEYVRSLPNRNQWLIDAVLDKMAKDIVA